MNIELNVLKGTRHLCITVSRGSRGSTADIWRYKSLAPVVGTKTIKITRERALRAIKKYIDKELTGETL